MARRNISLPEDLDDQARQAGLNVSALARDAIIAELDRRSRMAAFDTLLDGLDATYGRPSQKQIDEAQAWIRSAVPAHDAVTPRSSPRSPRVAS